MKTVHVESKNMTKELKQLTKKILKIKYFEEISLEWLEYKKGQIKQSSYYNYKFAVEKHLIPYFRK